VLDYTFYIFYIRITVETQRGCLTWKLWESGSTVLIFDIRRKWPIIFTPWLLYPQRKYLRHALDNRRVGSRTGLDAVGEEKIPCAYQENDRPTRRAVTILTELSLFPALWFPVSTSYCLITETSAVDWACGNQSFMSTL
jgi:hypothetical protein